MKLVPRLRLRLYGKGIGRIFIGDYLIIFGFEELLFSLSIILVKDTHYERCLSFTHHSHVV